jgi:hypothetical protein
MEPHVEFDEAIVVAALGSLGHRFADRVEFGARFRRVGADRPKRTARFQPFSQFEDFGCGGGIKFGDRRAAMAGADDETVFLQTRSRASPSSVNESPGAISLRTMRRFRAE